MNRRFAGLCGMGALLATQLLGASPAAAAPTSTGFALNRYQPAQPGSDWFQSESLDLRGVSCGTPTLCVAVAEQGRLLVSTNPTGGAAA